MLRIAALVSFGSLLLFGTLASADSYDRCLGDCKSAQAQCVEAITLYDATGVQEAKAACANEFAVCKKKCHDIDDLGPEGYQEKLKKDAEDAERSRQEQQQEQNGGIKLLNPSN